MDKGPCYDCKERHSGCHSNCDGYKEWLERYEVIKKKMRQQRDKEAIVFGTPKYSKSRFKW